MLYHWYELDLEAAIPAGNGQCIDARSCAPIIRYDRKSAREQARSGGCRISSDAFGQLADNDTPPDMIAARLRDAGLGAIGNPAYRFNPDRRNLKARTFEFAIAICSSLCARIASLSGQLMPRPGNTTSASHTMDLNGGNDLQRDCRDAKRQRFELRAR